MPLWELALQAIARELLAAPVSPARQAPTRYPGRAIIFSGSLLKYDRFVAVDKYPLLQ